MKFAIATMDMELAGLTREKEEGMTAEEREHELASNQYRSTLKHDLEEPDVPFLAKVRFWPKQGQTVLFPSWLVHRVEAPATPQTLIDEEKATRIAFAFNVATFDAGEGEQEGYARNWGMTAMPAAPTV